jgi:hypothetical protein
MRTSRSKSLGIGTGSWRSPKAAAATHASCRCAGDLQNGSQNIVAGD